MGKALDEAVVDIRNRITFIGGIAKRLAGKKLNESQYQNYAKRMTKSVKESEEILRQLEKCKAIFLGTRVTTLDYKWRLVLPCDIAKQFNRRLLFKEANDCLEIHRMSSIFRQDAPFTFVQEIKIQRINNRQVKKVVMIPLSLRESNSFYLGKKVVLAGRGDYLEIWPYPAE